ncbi:hypothetical protein HHK36_015104 [Tetracentron sinense]|uniref:WIT1/2 N-terminal helical bundle domain-containing protein n=1 Tax=Tetracentron sinense TaxID=13715 RepID=A0A834Z1E5_TETSI|nr:hypothetical protein HHK36_015104 [Tetracentron sinense]
MPWILQSKKLKPADAGPLFLIACQQGSHSIVMEEYQVQDERNNWTMGMDEECVDDTSLAVDDIDNGDPESDYANLHEVVSSNEEGMQELGRAREVLTGIELDLACFSEKLVNLDILLMHIVDRESDFEALAAENDNISADSVEMALEFDLLCGILDSEVRELDNFMATLQTEIVDARQKISSCEHLRETFSEMEEKLHDSEECLKQSQDQVSEMRMHSAKFQRKLLAFGGQENWNIDDGAIFSENDQFSNMNAKLKMQTAEQQRHILRMLEKSLARELDLEKKLSESRQTEEELKLELHSSDQEVFCMEEAAEMVWGRLFGAENSAEVLVGIAKELMGRLQVVQFNLNGSIKREGEVRCKLQDCMKQLKTKESSLQKLESSSAELHDFLIAQTTSLKASLREAEDKYILSNSEAFTLRERVNSLEEQLKESEIQLQNANASVEGSQEEHNALCSELSEMENVVEDLKEKISKAESRAESAEAKCTLLAETNLELNEELGFLKGSGNSMEQVNLLEKHLRECDIQLQYAKASVEASQEQQNMLCSAIEDMENLIEDLKSKVVNSESRAESAEENCVILSESNLELNEELNFLRGRMECLETSLHLADDAKKTTAQDIIISTKVITDLVMQVATERERLHKQVHSVTEICSLAKDNKMLVETLKKTKRDAFVIMSQNGNGDGEAFSLSKHDLTTATCTKASEEGVTESSATSFQVDNSAKDAPVCETEEGPAFFTSQPETMRTIEAGQLNSKYIFTAILILLISVIAVYLFQQESCPF